MMHKDFVLGLDGGGTSTVYLLADRHGQAFIRIEAPASNHRKTGLRDTREALLSGIREVARQAGLDVDGAPPFSSVCAGLAGVDTPDDASMLSQVLSEAVTTDHLQVVNDGEVALVGALEDEPGVLVISGTGSIAWAASVEGRRLRVGGWDYILGDEGSGYNIGVRVLREMAAAHDGRHAPTCLTEDVFQFFDVSNFNELLNMIYHAEMTPQRIASLAPLADEAAARGDTAAICILHEAARDLATLAASAARLAKLDAHLFQIAALGGVLLANGFFTNSFREALTVAAPNANLIEPRHTPAEGAVLLAMHALNPERKACV